MNTFRFRLIAAALAAAAVLSFAAPQQARADARVVVCAPDAPGTQPGPRRVVNPNTTTAYVLNNQGCAAVSSADLGWFSSQGFTLGANLFSIAKTGITATDFTSLVLPAGAYIQNIIFRNSTASATLGSGLKVGTTSGGTDVIAGIACGASCLVTSTDASLAKRVFSATATQTLSIDALGVQGFNGASIDVTVLYSLF